MQPRAILVSHRRERSDKGNDMAGYITKGGNKGTNRTGAQVSRKLRDLGWNISPAARRHTAYGITVSASLGRASVYVNTGLSGRDTQTAYQIAMDVAEWGRASDVAVSEGTDGAMWVRFDVSA